MPGKRTNTQKNVRANELWQESKRQGRPKQIWVWDVEPTGCLLEPGNPASYETYPGVGHWEKINVENN
jgi:hypothetical protein